MAVPAESTTSDDAASPVLFAGWAWGRTGSSPYTLAIPEGQITVDANSAFAVEHPAQGAPRIYTLSGQSRVSATARPEPVIVGAGEMLALTGATTAKPAAVPIDPIAMAILHAAEKRPVEFQQEPGPVAAAQIALARLGISVAQVVTLAAYAVAPALLAISLIVILMWLVRRRRRGDPAASASRP